MTINSGMIKVALNNAKAINATISKPSGIVGNISADEVSYDNTKSGLVATEVQTAIDTLAARIYIGETEPTDENVLIWIDTSATGTFTPEEEEQIAQAIASITGVDEEIDFSNADTEQINSTLDKIIGG